MIIFGIAVLISIVVVLFMYHKNKSNKYWSKDDTIKQIGYDTIVALCISAIASIVIAAGCQIVVEYTDDVPATYETVKTTEITALNDNAAMSGSCFLGTGEVDEYVRYYYMADTKLGAKMNYVLADDSYIVEDNSEAPRIEKIKVIPENVFLKYNMFPVHKYVVYIPEDSVTTDFSVDMQ
jgi:hypothetical protein